MRKLLLASLFSAVALNVFAQQARVRQFSAPLAGGVTLSEMDDKYNAQVYNLEAPNPDANVEKKRLRQIKEEVRKQFPYRRSASVRKTTAAKAPVVAIGFVADSFPGIPPDNDMAISKDNKAVSVINSNIAVLDGQTGKMTYRRSLKSFTQSVALNNLIDYRYDPKVMYDPEKDRFICVMLNATDARNWIVVGFSRTNNPAGTWAFYKFYGDYNSDSTWFDFPSIAMTHDEFFLTGNKIRYSSSWQTGFKETVIYQINKQDGYDSAATVNYQIWDSMATVSNLPIRNLYPVKGGASLHGPEQYFLSNRNFDVQNDTIFLVKVPGKIGSGGNLSITVLKSPLNYGVPPDGRQPDTSATLATNDGRILGAYAEYDEIQFVSASVNPVSGASGVYHGKIKSYTSSPNIEAQYFSIDTLDFGYPNISFTGNPWGLNQSLISFNYTGPNTYPGLGAISYDGAQLSELVQVKAGDSSIKILGGKQQRWGDYMGSQVDWNNIGTVWIEGIYGRRDKNYGNWMAKLNSPLLNVREDRIQEVQAKLYPNPAYHYTTVEFELGTSGGVSFVIYNAKGQVVDKVLETQCKAGHNLIRFNIASLPVGNYFLKGLSQQGEVLTTNSFVKQ